jgi:hypothetical protein
MDRPRYRRRDPQRTGPIRHAGEAWREEDLWRDSARRRDDAASGGVREGYRVIDEQIRRGRRMAQALDEEGRRDRSAHEGRRPERREDRDGRRERPERPGGFGFLAAQMRRTERLAREVLRQIGSARPNPWRLAELIFRLYVESMGDLALLGFDAVGSLAPRWEDRWGDRFEEDVERIERDVEESFDDFEEELEEDVEEERAGRGGSWPAAPSAPTVIRSTVPIPIYVWSHERTEIDLDLPAGAQSLDLAIEPLRVAGTDHPAHPAFEAELVSLADGPVILRIEVPRALPAGLYRRRVVIRATGEPIGALTVQVGHLPVEEER